MKIAIIDDSEIDRKLVASSLQKAGIDNEILESGDGKEALELIEQEHSNICLVFLDWQLPRMDGLEILKRMAQNPETANIPAIMSTSTNSPEDKEIAQLLNPKLAGFMVKPVVPEKIVELALPHVK